MKKITKLINGSVVLFIICLMAVLTLTSCNAQGDEYKVTEEEFNKAISLESFTNFKYERYEKTNEEEELKLTITVYRYKDKLKYNDDKPYLVSEVVKPFDGIIPLLPNEVEYSKFTYDDKKKQYVYIKNNTDENLGIQYVIKFKNKKVVEYNESYENGNIVRQHIIEYNVVKSSDVI